MDKESCKYCVFWINDNCEGAPEPCESYETYDDWDNLDSMIEEWR